MLRIERGEGMQLFEYIVQHYMLVISVAVIIVLAIIGYYADKTNFGQGKNNIEKGNDDSKTDDSEINRDLIDTNIEPQPEENSLLFNTEEELALEARADDSSNEDNSVIKKNLEQNDGSAAVSLENLDSDIWSNQMDTLNLVDKDLSTGVGFEQNKNDTILTNEAITEADINSFNEEFDAVLPKKELIDSDLLSDIEDLELDKTKKINFDDLSNMGDIELPKIKNLVQEEQDVWKF